MSAVLTVEGIGLRFGGLQALDNVSLAVEAGEIFVIIGPNGAGKTSLFNIVSGLYRPSTGRVRLAGAHGPVDVTGWPPHHLAAAGLSRSFQNLQTFHRMSVVDNVMVGCHLHERRNVFAHLLNLPWVAAQNRASRNRAETLLALVGIKADADRPASSLSYGELKRLEIARALATNPTLLLLDEPAAGCNASETQALSDVIRRIAANGTTIVLIEHDMKMVMQISHRIHVLNQGRTLAEGDAAHVSRSPEVLAAYLGKHGSQEAALAQG